MSTSSSEPPGTQFELPFQWDDGQFISPFVRSNEEQLSSLATFLVEYVKERAKKHCVITDLGCGDGKVLFSLCPRVTGEGWCMEARGYDLDADLIDMAVARRGEEDTSSPIPFRFEVRDICAMSVDDVVDPPEALHIVFVFLLTTALEQLKPLVEALMPKVDLFISNCWEVPYLEHDLWKKVGTCYVYRRQKE